MGKGFEEIRNYNRKEWIRLTKRQKDKIKKDFKKGFNPQEISKKRKVSLGVIHYTIKKLAELKRKRYIKNYQEKINNLSDFELGYICASIDGDGCIFVSKENERFRINLTITNRNPRIVNYFYELMGLDININSFRKKNKIEKLQREDKKKFGKVYTWRISDKKLLIILFKKINSYIIGKKEEIFCALKIMETNNMKTKKKYYQRLKKFKARYNLRVKNGN